MLASEQQNDGMQPFSPGIDSERNAGADALLVAGADVDGSLHLILRFSVMGFLGNPPSGIAAFHYECAGGQKVVTIPAIASHITHGAAIEKGR
jgi:hypothetical protein